MTEERLPGRRPTPEEDDERTEAALGKLEQRRSDVYELALQGVPKNRISKMLGIDRETVNRDVEYWRKKAGRYVRGLKAGEDRVCEEIGDTLKKLDWILENALMEFSTSKVAVSKNRFLGTALKAVSARARLLMETGYLPKAGVQLTVTARPSDGFEAQFGGESPLSKLDDPVSRRKAIEVASKMLKSSGGESSSA